MVKLLHEPGPAEVAHLHVEVRIRAKQAKVWRALLAKPDDWWPTEMRIFGERGEMEFDHVVGGQLIERGPKKSSILWGTILAAEPPRIVEWSTALTPRFGGPAFSLIKIELKEAGKDTLVRLDDSIVAPRSQKLQDNLREGWGRILDGLKEFLEKP